VKEWAVTKTLLLLLGTLALVSCSAAEKPRIAIAGLAIESSTFSPATTDEAAFHASTGQAILDTYPFFSGPTSLRDRAVWLGTVQGHALPGGAVTREAYESLMRKTLDGLRAQLPLAGLLFDIHGAMSVVGLEDPEGYQRIARPMYPLDKDMTDPDLTVKWVPTSDRFK
jgi:microcystin degradation protein MlrC